MEPETKWVGSEEEVENFDVNKSEKIKNRETGKFNKVWKENPAVVLGAAIVILADIGVIFYVVATRSESQYAPAQLFGEIIGFGIILFILQHLLCWILRKTGFNQYSNWTALIIAALLYLAVFSFFNFATTTSTPIPPAPSTCSSFVYSAWGACQSSNMQTRTVISSSPIGCIDGSPSFFQSCTYVPSGPTPIPALNPNSDITNPDYVANPSAYLVDRTGKVPSQIPVGQALWVEQILSPTSIEVSYIITQAGANVVELKNLSIPGLGWPPDFSSGVTPTMQQLLLSENYPASTVSNNCWVGQAQMFLSQNVLNQSVYLSRTPINNPLGAYGGPSVGWQLFMADGSDLAAAMTTNGYGLIPKNLNVVSYNPSESELYKDQQVASLAGRGAWGICR